MSEGSSQAGAGRTAAGAGPGCQGGLWTWAPHAGELVRPLWPHEYLNSVMDQDISLHSRRLSWETPLHFDNPTYITTHYLQVRCRPLTPPTPASWWPDPGLQLAEEPLPRWGTSKPPSLTAVPSQVLRDYLQGKLLVSPKAGTRLARLAALQHRSKAQEDHLLE